MTIEELSKRYGFRYEEDSDRITVFIKHRVTSHIIDAIEKEGNRFLEVFNNGGNKDELRINFFRVL